MIRELKKRDLRNYIRKRNNLKYLSRTVTLHDGSESSHNNHNSGANGNNVNNVNKNNNHNHTLNIEIHNSDVTQTNYISTTSTIYTQELDENSMYKDIT